MGNPKLVSVMLRLHTQPVQKLKLARHGIQWNCHALTCVPHHSAATVWVISWSNSETSTQLATQGAANLTSPMLVI